MWKDEGPFASRLRVDRMPSLLFTRPAVPPDTRAPRRAGRRADVRAWAAVVAVAMVWTAVSPMAAEARPAAERVEKATLADLEQAWRELEGLRDRIEAARRTRDEQSAAASRTHRAVVDALARVEQARDDVDRQRARVLDARAAVDEAAQAYGEVRRRAAQRAASLYKRGAGGRLLAVVAGATDMRELADRSRAVHSTLRADRLSLEETTAARARVEMLESRLAAEERELGQALEAERRVLARRRGRRVQRARALGRTDDRLDRLVDDASELEDRVARLEQEIRRTAGVEAVAASRSAVRGSEELRRSYRQGWAWPADGRVTSGYGWRWGRPHRGVDIAAPPGTPILAARDGRVVHAGPLGGYGNAVRIDHGMGVTTVYGHMSRVLTAEGDVVVGGLQIGEMGCTGRCTGPHLHFEIRGDGVAHDPEDYLP